MLKCAFLLITILSGPALVFPDTITVPDDYAKIQEAIDAAVNGDTILVKPGIYVENIDYLGKAVALKSLEGPYVTAIDGNEQGSVVTFTNEEGQDSVLEGFTIMNGSSSGVDSSISSPTIMSNMICWNRSPTKGGGIYAGGGSPLIMNNDISWNHAGMSTDSFLPDYGGGGIYVSHSGALIANNTITNNTIKAKYDYTEAFGAGIFVGFKSHVTITNNVISQNTVQKYHMCDPRGGGIGCVYAYSYLTITNNIISRNKVEYSYSGPPARGGGVHISSEECLMANNIIFGNRAYQGGGVDLGGGTVVTLANSILWANTGAVGQQISVYCKLNVHHCDVDQGTTQVLRLPGAVLDWGPGNIDADPLFVDPINGDFHIKYTSPCRDAGDNATAVDPFDFEGDPRIAWGGTVDMGPDEFFPHLYVTGAKIPGGSIHGRITGLPGTAPLGLFLGSGVLPSPVPTMWGEYWLQAPWVLYGPLGAIPADGVIILPTTLPGSIPAPYDVPMQALIGLNSDSLSNLCVLQVR